MISPADLRQILAAVQAQLNAPVGQGFPDTVATLFQAANFVINANGTFEYSSSPAALGNLISSDTFAAGTDPSGNAYLAGTTTYFSGTQAVNLNGNTITFYSAPGPGGPWSAQQSIFPDPVGRLETSDAAGDIGLIMSGKSSVSWVYAPVGNTAVSTNIATYNIRANELHAGDIWEASFDGGFLLGATTAETLNFNLLLGGAASGGTNIAGTFALSASGRLTITVRFNIATDGAAGTFWVGGNGSETSGATNFPLSLGNGGSPSAAFAVNTTIANVLALQATWGGAGGVAQRCNINFATLKKVA